MPETYFLTLKKDKKSKISLTRQPCPWWRPLGNTKLSKLVNKCPIGVPLKTMDTSLRSETHICSKAVEKPFYELLFYLIHSLTKVSYNSCTDYSYSILFYMYDPLQGFEKMNCLTVNDIYLNIYYICRSPYEQIFLIGGRQVCFRGWRMILNINLSTWYKVFNYFKKGLKVMPSKDYQSLSKHSFNGHKSNVARAWMENYFTTTGEKLPYGNLIHLAPFLTKQSVYKIMKEELESRDDPVMAYSRFCCLWSAEFSYVKIPPVSFF